MNCWIRVSECSQVLHWYETQWQDREIAQSGCRTSWEQWQTSSEWWLAGANKFSEWNSLHFCRPAVIPRTSTAALVAQHFNSRVLEEATSCHMHGAANFFLEISDSRPWGGMEVGSTYLCHIVQKTSATVIWTCNYWYYYHIYKWLFTVWKLRLPCCMEVESNTHKHGHWNCDIWVVPEDIRCMWDLRFSQRCWRRIPSFLDSRPCRHIKGTVFLFCFVILYNDQLNAGGVW